MNTRTKPVISLSVLVLFSLAMTCDATAAPLHKDRRTSEQIEACVAAIGEHADYSEASRIVHVVSRLDQRNYEELEIRVATTIYGENDTQVMRSYTASCVTATMGNLVRFRISPSAG
jgi:hypothetical protein